MARPIVFFEFGAFRMDVANRLLLREGEPVSLTPKAFDTLSALVEHRGRVLAKEELIGLVWPDTFVTEATLSQNIYLLRKALATAGDRCWIHTHPRRGYRFDGEVTAVAAETDRADLGADLGVGGVRSLAVLPLTPLPRDEEGVFLGLGIADALITSLSNVRQLSVRPTSAILRLVDAKETAPATAGRELGVEAVLEGTVQRHGNRLRVTVQLVSVERGVPLWAESFRGAFTDPFEAQDAIAREVVRRLHLTLTRQEASTLSRPPTPSPEAHRTYVRGRYAWNRRTAAELRRAIELFRQAVADDPAYARAYSGLADALILLPFYGTASPAATFRQAREAARRALELDDRLAEAHTSLAYTDFVHSRDWSAAEEGFHRALERDPAYATAHHWYAFLLTALGRHEEAIELASRAHGLDPLSLVIGTDLALTYYFAHRLDPALEQLSGVLEVAPDFGYAHFALALCHSEAGQHALAIEAGRRASRLLADSDAARAVLGYALARGGQEREARDMLDRRGDGGQPELAGASHRALLHAGLGDGEAALGELERSLEERSRFVVFLGVWPAFDGLRSDARLTALLERLGLPAPPG